MAHLFTTPIDAITPDQVRGLLGLPESQTVEFKEKLSTKDGRPDGWLTGEKLGEFARDKLLKEVVAFANTSGGHVILGLREGEGSPPTATAIEPVARCIDLAERLSQMAQNIEPPIPMLLVQGVRLDGDAGVVVFRVPESRSAPHRAPDKQCYVRRGTTSVPIGMREIQDMTIAAGRRGEWTTAQLAEARAQFHHWIATPLERFERGVGIRVSAVPAGSPLQLGRLYGQPEPFRAARSVNASIDGRVYPMNIVRAPDRCRTIFRGVRYTFSETDSPSVIDLRSDGVVLARHFFEDGPDKAFRVHAAWFVGAIFNALKAAHYLRMKADVPELEYAIEVEIDARPREPVPLMIWTSNYEGEAGEIEMPLLVDGLSFGPSGEVAALTSSVVNDLRDAAGTYSAPLVISAIAEA